MAAQTKTVAFETFKSRLYQIGQADRFRDRITALQEYGDKTGPDSWHFRVRCRGTTSIDVRLTRDVYTSHSKTQYYKYEHLKRKIQYHYIKVYERNTVGKTQRQPLVMARVDLKGQKMELIWLSRGKKTSGKASMKLFNLFYRALRPQNTFLHDDSHVSIKISEKVIPEEERKLQKRKNKKYKTIDGRKKKAMKKTKKGPHKTVNVGLKTLRSLATGHSWYENLGFKPAKLQDISYYFSQTKYNQHPAAYRSAVDKIRKFTIKDMYEMWPASSTHHANLDDIRKQINIKTRNSPVSVATITQRVLGLIRRKPKSIVAQRTFKKFKQTFITPYSKRLPRNANLNRVQNKKLREYMKHMDAINVTCIFKKTKPVV